MKNFKQIVSLITFGLSGFSSVTYADCTKDVTFDVSDPENIKIKFPYNYALVESSFNGVPDPGARVRLDSVQFASDMWNNVYNNLRFLVRVHPSADFTCKYEIGYKSYVTLKLKPFIIGRYLMLEYGDSYEWSASPQEELYAVKCVVKPYHRPAVRQCEFSENPSF